jgi:transposase
VLSDGSTGATTRSTNRRDGTATMAHDCTGVVGGVDTHADLHVAAALDSTGRLLGTESFTADPAGHRRLLAWLRAFGSVEVVGVEGTGSYGAGLTRHLLAEGVRVVEADRHSRRVRRRRGKSDTVDAEEAARAALSGEARAVPKARDGDVECIRALRVVRRSAMKSRVQAIHQMRMLLVSAPDDVRERLRSLRFGELVRRCARLRVGEVTGPSTATRLALRELALRVQALDAQIARLDAEIAPLVARAAPSLLALPGVGPDTAAALLVAAGDNPRRLASEASFARLCGTTPLEASSGKVTRHRLNRGGDRQANHALWRIVLVRMGRDPRTQAYVERRLKEGLTKREVMRCLKRYVAREVYSHLVGKAS